MESSALVPRMCWGELGKLAKFLGFSPCLPVCRSTQAATWFVMPFYQVYAEAGDFTVKDRQASRH
jgi:hypothetical protein